MYILLIVVALVLSIVGTISKNNKVVGFILLALIVVAGFRHDVGRDYKHYEWIFQTVATGIKNYTNEIGYLWFLKQVILIKGTQQLVFLIFAFCTVILNYLFIRRYSDHLYLSLLTYICVGPLYLSSFNQIRQYLAIGIFLVSIKFILDKKFWKYLFITFFTAFFVHLSIILTLPVYFVLNRNFSIKSKLIIFVIAVVSLPLLEFLILSTPYAYFVLSRVSIDYNKSLIFAQMAISVVIILFEKFFMTEKNRPFFNMNYFSLLMLLPVFVSPSLPFEVFQRLNNYFAPYIMILFPYLLTRFKQKSFVVVSNSAYILFLLAYYLRNTMIIAESQDMAPYTMNFNLFNF